MDVIIRGNVVEFTTTFLDVAGAPTNPAAVALRLYFRVASGYSPLPPAPIPMVRSGDLWSYDWDTITAAAYPGIVWWSIIASDPHGADEGFFTLTANPANPNP